MYAKIKGNTLTIKLPFFTCKIFQFLGCISVCNSPGTMLFEVINLKVHYLMKRNTFLFGQKLIKLTMMQTIISVDGCIMHIYMLIKHFLYKKQCIFFK